MKRLHLRGGSRSYVSIAVIMACTIIAIVSFYYHKAGKRYAEALPAVDVSERSNAPISAETQQKIDPKLEQFFLAFIQSLKQKGSEDIDQASADSQPDDQVVAEQYDEDSASYVMNKVEYSHTQAGLEQCIERIRTANPNRLEQEIQDLWILAANLGVPEEALETLEYIVMQNRDPEVLNVAEFALADLQRLVKENERVLEDEPLERLAEDPSDDLNETYASESDSDDSAAGSGQNELEYRQEDAETLARIEKYHDQALSDPDELNRKKAIQEISNIRSETAVDILISAAGDPNPKNRHIALQALWYSAADGLETEDSRIWLCLKTAMSDEDARVVEIATKALVDIERLEHERIDAEHAAPSIADELVGDSDMDRL